MGWVQALCVLAVVLGVYLRTRGLFDSVMPLWLDEVSWALNLTSTGIFEPSLRPLGFVALSKAVVATLGPTEVAFRLVPWLAGTLTSILALPLARALFRSPAAQLLLVASLALHPVAIDYSKEFKPYALSLLLHLACLLCALWYRKSRGTAALSSALTLAFGAVLFAQDIVFLYPGFYLLMGFCAWQAQRFRHLMLIAAGAVATLGLLAILTLCFWSALEPGSKDASDYWGRKYDVFYLEKKGQPSRASWWFTKYQEMAAFPGERRSGFQPRGPIGEEAVAALANMDHALWCALHFLGLLVMIRQRRAWELVYLVSALATLSVFNAFGVWPFGAFRTNLFLLAYVTPIAAFALERRQASQVPSWQPLAALAVVVLPLLVFERGWHERKVYAPSSSFLQALELLITLQGDPPSAAEPLVLDFATCEAWHYYFTIHPNHRELGRRLNARFTLECAKAWRERAHLLAAEMARTRRQRVWVLLTTQQMNEAMVKKARYRNGLRVTATPLLDEALILRLDPKRRRR